MSERGAREIEELTERLSAYIDGELSDDECRQVEATLARDETARRVLSELRDLSHTVGSLPLEAGPADITERVLRAMERRELLETDAGLDAVGAPAPRPGWRLFRLLASAAVVGLAVGVGYFAIRSVSEPGGDILVARHEPPTPTPAPRPAARPPVEEPAMMAKGGGPVIAKRGALSEADSLAVAAGPAKKTAPAAPPESPPEQGADSTVAEADQRLGFKAEQTPAVLAKAKPVTRPFVARTPEVIFPEELTTQAFEAVGNRVTITVPDPAAQQLVIEQVTRFFDRNRLTNARDLPPRLQVAQTQALYVEGWAGVNTADSRSRQYLVRAAPKVVDDLIVQVRNEVPEATIGTPGGDWDQAQMMSLRAPEQSAKYVMPNVETLGEDQSRDIHDAREREDQSGDIHAARQPEPTTRPSMANVPVQIASRDDAYDLPGPADQVGRPAQTWASRGPAAGQDMTPPTEERAVGDRPADDRQLQQMPPDSRQAGESGPPGQHTQLVNVVIKVSVAETATQPASQPAG